jgi:hypothetical protein
MKVGTRSVLFGVHAFWFHFITVLLAWIELYGVPNWKEFVCIFIHDLGYWGKPNMDGAEGEEHPKRAAEWAYIHMDKSYYELCLFHSRTCAKKHNTEPSKLCWADKLSIKYDPWWFYLMRALFSGEVIEYRSDAVSHGILSSSATYIEWFAWARERGMRAGYTMNSKTSYELENLGGVKCH